MPSIHVAIQRLRARPTCRLEPNARLGWWSRVLNLSGDSSRIQIGERSVVKGELFTFRHGGEIRIGRWCYLGDGSRVWSACRIHIGDRVLISHQVNIFDSLTHPIDAGLRHEHFRHIVEHGHPSRIDLGERPVTIEDDAWIGAGATILRGVRVGIGSIVGAGSVVTHDVPDWTVVAGNPAKFVRTLHAPAAVR